MLSDHPFAYLLQQHLTLKKLKLKTRKRLFESFSTGDLEDHSPKTLNLKGFANSSLSNPITSGLRLLCFGKRHFILKQSTLKENKLLKICLSSALVLYFVTLFCPFIKKFLRLTSFCFPFAFKY